MKGGKGLSNLEDCRRTLEDNKMNNRNPTHEENYVADSTDGTMPCNLSFNPRPKIITTNMMRPV